MGFGTYDGWTDGRTDGRTDFPCVLQDFVPFGAAALLPFNLNHTLLKQGTGTADHLLPLGCYCKLENFHSVCQIITYQKVVNFRFDALFQLGLIFLEDGIFVFCIGLTKLLENFSVLIVEFRDYFILLVNLLLQNVNLSPKFAISLVRVSTNSSFKGGKKHDLGLGSVT